MAATAAHYLAWLREIGLLLKRVLKDDGSFFLNIAGTNSDPWIAADAANAMRDVFALQNSIIWVKSVTIGDDSFGHFKPVNSRRYLNHTHEHVFHFTKDGETPLDRLAVGVPFKDKSNIARWGHAEDRRCAGDVWFIPYQTIRVASAARPPSEPLPGRAAGALHQAARQAGRDRARPLPRHRLHAARRAATRLPGHRHRDRPPLRGGGGLAAPGAADLRSFLALPELRAD